VIQVWRDTEGLRLVLGEMLEREHDLLRLSGQMQGKDPSTQARLAGMAAKVTLSPGYERWATHLMLLERQHKLSLPLGDLLAVEVTGLEILDRARLAHRYKHPNCYACGMPQNNRFMVQCEDCGAKFHRGSK
jgi:translation initiation factor IF-1